MREIIQRMAEGDVAHQADGLKFGLYNALRQRGMGDYPFARLRCPHKGCANYDSPVSYTALGDGIRCTMHKGSGAATAGVMECTECGHARTDRFTWCKGCRRMFQ